MSEEKKTTTTENKEEETMKKKLGKGVAIGLGLTLLGAGAAYLWSRRKKDEEPIDDFEEDFDLDEDVEEETDSNDETSEEVED